MLVFALQLFRRNSNSETLPRYGNWTQAVVVDSAVAKQQAGMEIVRRKGCTPRFPFELFQEQQKAYDSGPEKHVWESLEDLERAAAPESSATILGHIGAETAKKWLGWELGELYAVGCRGGVLFCIHGGTVVV